MNDIWILDTSLLEPSCFVLKQQDERPDSIAVIDDGTMMVDIDGPLSVKAKGMGASYEEIQSAIETAERVGVERVLFLHNSPGGTASGMTETAGMIKQMTMPTYAWSSTMMASASYGLASACDYVYATPTAMVGSVGAMIIHFDISRMFEQMGVKPTEIGFGKNKMQFSPFKPLSESAESALTERVKECAEGFQAMVRMNRPGIDAEVFDSGVYVGKKSVEKGLTNGLITCKSEVVKFISET